MADTYPRQLLPFISWANAHAATWAATPAAVGITAPQAAAVTAAAATAQAAYDAAQAAKGVHRSAVAAQNDAVTEAKRTIGDVVKVIRAYALQQADPQTVYTAADIPAPASPSPVPPPALPTDVRIGLDAVTGALELTWKASNPPGSAGTSYLIRRKLQNETAAVILGATGTKKYVDSALPVGTTMVSYTIQGQRSGLSGPQAEVMVRFGVIGGAPILMSVAQGPAGSVKLAA